MKNILLLIAIATGATFLTGATQTVQGQSMVVIVNNENPKESLKQIEVKLYYLRKVKQVWPGTQESIQPVVLSNNSSVKETFLANVLKMPEAEVTAYFKQRQFANAEQMPPSFSTEADVIKYVSENKGAIGYVSQSAYNSSSSLVKSVLEQ